MTEFAGNPGPPPAGWYMDSDDSTVLRWWDGRRWTSSVRPIPHEEHVSASWQRAAARGRPPQWRGREDWSGGAGRFDPSNGAGRLDPGNGAGRLDPSNGAGRLDPSNGAGRLDPSNGAGRLDPSNGAGRLDPGNGAGRLDPSNGAARFDPGNGAARFDPGNGAARLDPGNGAARLDPGNGAGRFDPGNGAGRFDPGNGAGRFDPGNGAGRFDPGNGAGRFDPGNGAGRFDPGNGAGRFDPGNGAGRLDPGNGAGRFDPGNGAGRFDPGNGAARFDPGNGAGRFDPGNGAGRFDPGNGAARFDPGNGAGRFDPGNGAARFDPGNGAGRFDPGNGAARFDPGNGAGRFDPGNGAARFDPGNGAARFDPGNGAARFDPSNGAARLDPGNGAGRFDPGNGAGRFDPGNGAARLDPGNGAGRLDPGNGAGRFDPGSGAARLDPGSGAARLDPGSGAARLDPGNGAGRFDASNLGDWNGAPVPSAGGGYPSERRVFAGDRGGQLGNARFGSPIPPTYVGGMHGTETGMSRVAATSVLPREGVPRQNIAPLVMSVLFGLSLLVLAIGYLIDSGALRLIGVAGAAIFGVGSAPLQMSQQVPLDVRLGVTVLTGLSVPLVVGSVLVLAPLWHPLLAALAVGSAAAVVHVLGCRRVLAQVPREVIFRAVRPRYQDLLSLSVACTLGGTLLWVISALTLGHMLPGVLGTFGFLPKISVFWYAGLLLVLAGIVLARSKPEPQAIFGAVSLLAALTLTPAVVYGTPRSQSAAKHMDLVQLILQVHHLDHNTGIYQAYSGMFSGVAWLCRLAGIGDVTGVATYWPFFIDLAALVALRFFFGRLTSSPYRVWAAITLAVLVDAIGADYFSPQAVGFALGLPIFGLAFCRDVPGLSERTRLALLIFAGCALAVTHELSPYIAGGALVILAIFRVIRPWYLPATILIPAALWALLNKGDVSGFLSFYQLGDLSNFAPPQTVVTPGLSRLPVVGESSDALALGLLVLIALAAVGFLRNIKDKAVWAYGLSAGTGLFLIVANPYGNEGIFRASLFAIPWLAAMTTRALPGRAPRWVSGVYGAIAVGLTATFLVAMFAQDNQAVVRPADLRALQIDQDMTSPDSYLLSLAYGDLPTSIDFPAEGSHAVEWATLMTPAEVQRNRPIASDANDLARAYLRYAEKNGGPTNQLYAIWSPASAAYAVNYGLETVAQVNAWRSLISTSHDWILVYSQDGTCLFRVAPGVKPAPLHRRSGTTT